MNFLPLCLDVSTRKVLLVGGGKVAAQKLKTLGAYAQNIWVVAPDILPSIQSQAVRCLHQPYDPSVLIGADLVYACTDDRAVNRGVVEDARQAGVLVNAADDPTVCDFISPAVFKSGRMSVAVSSNGEDPQRSVQWRNTLAGGGRIEHDKGLRSPTGEKFDDWPENCLYIVGFGPGDPELMTRKAHRILNDADVLYHDDLVDVSFLAEYPGRKHSVGKRGGCASTPQSLIHELLLESVRKKERAVRLKGGDPSLFSRVGEELSFLRAQGVEVRVIPGVSAAQAIAAQGGFPLTRRGVSRNVEFRTAHGSPAILPGRKTVVYYMAASRLQAVQAEILAEGWPPDTPVALGHSVTGPQETLHFATLATMTAVSLPSPLTVVIGEVVAASSRST